MDQSLQPAPSYFQAMLDRGTKRNVDEPQLQLGLQDIARKVRKLGKGGPSSHLTNDTRAHYLLSASGVNTSRAIAELEELAGTTAHEVPGTTINGGVKEVLAQQYQSDFQKMVDGHIKRAHEDFDKMIEERLHGVDWDAHRQRIYEHFGLKRPQNANAATAIDGGLAGRASFGRSNRHSRFGGASGAGRSSYGVGSISKSVIGTPGPRGARSSAFGDMSEKMPEGFRPAHEDSLQRKKQGSYSDRVKDLNVARLQKGVYPILAKFSEVESEPSNEDTSMLVNAYQALIEITGEDARKTNVSESGVIKERQYMNSYLDDNPNSPQQMGIRKRIIDGSRRFLEKNFFSQLETVVIKNPREANMGGVPTALAKVKGFVRVRAARKELGPDIEALQEVNGDYCWAVIFYLLRSGLFHDALQYVEENIAAFRQIDRSFIVYLQAYVNSDDRRLPEKLSTSIENEYSSRRRLGPQDSVDPYKMMCCKIIGRCELSRRSLDGITNDMMDWIWLQFALARESTRADEFQHQSFGLEDVRHAIKDIGDRYFGSGSDIANAPTTFFFMQVLAGMFEKAVADLYPHNYVSAVHFAIGLDFYGLLRVSDISNSDDLLTTTTRQQSQIAFGSMVGLYTRDFRTANATAAVDYITLICLNADLTGDIGRAQRELCHQALAEVVLETREFAQLLGDIRADGQRIMGAIEARLPLIGLADEKEFLKHVTLVAARTAEEQGRVTDAALLYHLAEDYNKVLQVVNDAVSQALTTDIGEKPARLTPLKPRDTNSQNNQGDGQLQASLSLTAVDDPIQLARDYRQLYNSDAMYSKRIERKNSEACEVLLQLAEARRLLEACQWSQVIDVSLNIYPLCAYSACTNKSSRRPSQNPTFCPQTSSTAASPPSGTRRKHSKSCRPAFHAPSAMSWYGRSCRAAISPNVCDGRSLKTAFSNPPFSAASRRPRISWYLRVSSDTNYPPESGRRWPGRDRI
jgi:nuclear pore complex protein Nup93